ncbi:hypothetical protein SDC9_131912 [bioreactor metagenome]|uniref:Uncharacterized protein n=1 Tax=bioreactor metagenome TaxID=1076179 RepID=A0A645D650_9ZZZZ
MIDDFQQQCRQRDDHERSEDGLRQAKGGSGEGGGVAADQAGDELEAEEDQHHEDRDAEQQVVDGDVAGLGDIHQRRGVEDRPDGLEQPPGSGTHRLGEPVERGRDQRGGSFADGIADRGDHGNVAHAHHEHQHSRRRSGGSDGLADVPEEVDERHARAADHRRAAGDEDADLPARGEVRVGGVRAEAPHDRGHDQREHAEDQADGHHCADDGAQLVDPRQAVSVWVDVDVHRHQQRRGHDGGEQIEHGRSPWRRAARPRTRRRGTRHRCTSRTTPVLGDNGEDGRTHT